MYASFNARALGISLSAVEAIAIGGKAGFGGIDLLIRDLVESRVDLDAIRRMMVDHEMRPGAWPLPVDWRGDEPTFVRDLNALPRLAEAAAALGFTRSATRVMSETPGRPESESERAIHLAETFALHVDRIGAAAKVLERHGSRLGLEVVGVESFQTGSGWPFLTRLADLEPLLQAEAPNVGVLVDAFHLHAAGEPMETGLKWGVERVVWVHVADLPSDFAGDRSRIQDGDRGLPGESGLVACASLLSLLADAGYDGPVTAEPLAGCRSLAGQAASEVAQRAIGSLREIWPQAAIRDWPRPLSARPGPA